MLSLMGLKPLNETAPGSYILGCARVASTINHDGAAPYKSSPFIGESSSTSTLSTIFEGAPGITSSDRRFSTMEPSFVLATTSYEPALDRDGPSNENAFRAPASSNANSSSSILNDLAELELAVAALLHDSEAASL